jgi:hypothetical protein
MLKFARNVFVGACIALAVLALGMWGATTSPSYNECESSYSQEPSTNEQNNTQQRVPTASFRDTVGNFLVCESVFANENGDAMTGVATVLLALVTGGLVFLAHEQSKTARAQLRAYVYLKEAVVGKPVDGKEWIIRLRIQNYGVTPAHHVTVKFEQSIGVEIIGDAIIPHTNAARTKGPFSIAPSSWKTLHIPFPELPLDWQELRAGKRRAFLWGGIDYQDTFERNQHTGFQMDHALGELADFSYTAPGNDST